MRNRVLKVIVIFMFLFSNVVFADIQTVQPSVNTSVTTPQNITYEHCTKMFAVNKEKLFYLTLGAITANKFTIEEIQTNNGYIIFKAANNKYLASISGIDNANSILKITPSNNIYYFQPGILLNMYKYIELNLNTEIK
ncbi:MAG: hypothetical protein MJ231_01845 [bacterium]|nr:hypothetical protein [bacterium]